MMKKVLFIATLLMIMVACNKNNSAVKKLDGEWIATKYEISDATTSINIINSYNEVKFTFIKCKLKDNEYCSAEISLIELDGTKTIEPDFFVVKEKGTVLQIGTSANGNDDWLIEELSKSKLRITKDDGTEKTKLEFTKK